MNLDKPVDMSGPALRAILTISREWGLSERQRRDLLGGPTLMTLAAWERAARMRERIRIPDGVLIRIQLVMQIRIGIKRSMPDPDDQAAWLRVRNLHLEGQAPLTLMTRSSQDLALVRDLVGLPR